MLIGVMILALLSAAPARSAAAAAHDGWDGQQQVTEKFSKTVPLGAGGAFDLSNISGDVVITGGAGSQVVIDATKRGKTAEDIKAVQIEVTETATRVEVRTQYPREKRNINASVDYTVTLPRGASVTVRTVSGNVKVSTVDGALRADTVSGTMSIASAAQLQSAKSVSGDVTVQASGSAGDVTAGSVSGSVVLRTVKARSVELNSVSGDVTLAEVACDRVKANTISGKMGFAGLLAKGGRYILQSHSGDVIMTIAGEPGFELNASSFSGDITSAYELTSKVGGADAPKQSRMKQSMRGTWGDGSAVIELNSFSGDIKVVKK
jgi:DUF4097 and DUF4098 domain-containing protein YvlB